MKKSIFKTISLLVIAGVFGGVVSAVIVSKLNKNQSTINFVQPQMPVTTAAFSPAGEPVNFSDAAEHTVSSVVHVKVTYRTQRRASATSSERDLLEYFFGPDAGRQSQPQSREYTPRGAGSGVIISPDGYIVTNNHVIDRANEVTVTFNDKTTLTAKIVGKDPNTDIALLKVDAKDLPALSFGDSDNLRLGEWVLAVGNPFNFTSTVTTGIVSAKARRLNVMPSEFGIESFIQTDAAVNPGNSGGALVNLRAELVGIPSVIASRTGSYEGYSFAVPSNIVKKVVEDLMEHGVVQRALLGIRYVDLNDDFSAEELAEIVKDYGIKNLKELQKYKGVYVSEVLENSAAKEAGLQKGDIITQIGGKDVLLKTVVVEEIGKLRPGDKINITVIRDGKTKQFTATLRNKAGNTDVEVADKLLEVLGATFETVSKELAKELQIGGGVQVAELSDGKLKSEGIRKGFIITKVNQSSVTSVDELRKVINGIKSGGVFIEGVYPDGQAAYIAFGM